MALVVVAVAILIASGLFALAAFRAPSLGSAIGAVGAVAGCSVAMAPALRVLWHGSLADLSHGWPVPSGALVVGIDPLSAFFLVPLLVLSALTAVSARE